MDYTKELRKKAKELGADRFGVGDLDILQDYPTVPPDLLKGFTSGISIGIKLTDPVIDALPDSRRLYANQYRVVNDKLNDISFQLAKFIEENRGRAQPVPASKVVSEGHWQSFISHKAVARAAGMGWIGKSLMLINPDYGPRLRWATILTDLDLDWGEPIKNKCGDCTECVEACIVDAFEDSGFEDYPRNRRSCFDVDSCARKLEEFADDPDIGSMVCGICIKACPWGSTEVKNKTLDPM
ncbi:MAG: 4Fe-4S double cluster binding domain-containing protein [Candidatus Bipolaricaulota bacterium]